MESIYSALRIMNSALEGNYGWVSEVLAIAFIVILFNFVAKWVLRKLHERFKSQKRYFSDSLVRALYRPLSYYVWIFAFVLGLQLVLERGLNYPNFSYKQIALSLAFIGCFIWFLLRWKNNVTQYLISMSRNKEITLDPGKIDAINKLLTIFILFVGLLLFLEATNSNLNTLIAFGGVGGLAIAFASQEIIANFFGGLMVYLNQPFSIGDWVSLPEKNIEGHIEEIGWYMTRIRTFEKRPVYVPNSIFTKAYVVTPSRMTHRRFLEVIGLRYADMPAIQAIIHDIQDMLKNHKKIDQSFKSFALLKGFNQSSVDINVCCFSQVTDGFEFDKLKQELLMNIYKIISSHGAEMAFPTTQIEITKAPSNFSSESFSR
ncbi:MscS family inner membrane protein YnaI [Candidatus Rubidus massiliensis]|nr:MscS family inner membrane protein YnaI [Candidatus Rubidus massiliensis]